MDFEKLIFDGGAPCIEAYAFNLHLEDWVEEMGSWEAVAQAPVEDLTAALASCIDYILPNNRTERSDYLKKSSRFITAKSQKAKSAKPRCNKNGEQTFH